MAGRGTVLGTSDSGESDMVHADLRGALTTLDLTLYVYRGMVETIACREETETSDRREADSTRGLKTGGGMIRRGFSGSGRWNHRAV